MISAKLKLPKEVSFASPLLPPTHFAPLPLTPPFFVSLAHFTLVRRPSHARHFFASCQPTNQAAKSSSDVAPTDKWSALGLPACGHYWSMRFSVLLPSVFFPSSRPHPSLPTLHTPSQPTCSHPSPPVSSSCVAPSPRHLVLSPLRLRLLPSPRLVPSRIACLLSLVFHPRVYILFYVTLFHYLSHFLGIPVRS